MGRITTDIAAAAVNASNLPERDQLPVISAWDALLPRDCADKVVFDPNKKVSEYCCCQSQPVRHRER